MEVSDLTQSEKVVLVALARHLVHIDGEVSDSELYDLIRLGVEIGRADFEMALAASEDIHRDRAKTLALARDVDSPVVRARIHKELDRIARGDDMHPTEASFLADLAAGWAD